MTKLLKRNGESIDFSQYQKLNLGCGQFHKPDYLNVDLDPRAKSDAVCDLGKFPYPFPDNHFSMVESDHLFEHIHNQIDLMREIHRVLKPGGTLRMRVPHFSRGFMHYDHKIGFDVTYPLYFDRNFCGGYTGIDFEHIQTKMKWFAQRYLKKKNLPPLSYAIAVMLGSLFDFFGNLSPYVCSRLWCFWVGGFEEVEFQFKKAL